MIAKIPAMSGDAKEDAAKRVLQHLVSGEQLQWNMSHAISKEGLVVYRPGEKDFICSLKEASQLYMNASALLEGKSFPLPALLSLADGDPTEYCRLDGQPLPAWFLEQFSEGDEQGLSVSVAIGTEMFTAETLLEEEQAGREHVAVQALEWLQEAKNRKFTDMIKASQSQARPVEGSAEAERAEDDLNDVD